MVDHVSPSARSAMMRAVRGSDTGPEIQVRRALHAAGFRFRLHQKDLPGRPDIVLPRYKLAVFVHGCFWHGHRCPRGRMPSTNTEFWTQKIAGNKRRDERVQEALADQGWSSAVIWACRLQPDTRKLLRRLSRRRLATRAKQKKSGV
jgi:DNA mismatch endonuclease, patch repair protein